MGSLFARQPASPPLVTLATPPGATSVKIVSYNILAASYQHYLKYVPKRYIEFSYRRKKVVRGR